MKISEILTEYRKTPELNAVMKFFLHDEYADMVFAVVVPKESGLSRSVWVSQRKAYPYIVVAARTGTIAWPVRKDIALRLDSNECPYADVKSWIQQNRDLLLKLSAEDISLKEFYENMVKFDNNQFLVEMANIKPEQSGVPYDLNCMPRQSSHDMLVKVEVAPGQVVSIGVRSNQVNYHGLKHRGFLLHL